MLPVHVPGPAVPLQRPVEFHLQRPYTKGWCSTMSRITLISSDGHVAALMSDYRPYLESEYLEDFEAFLVDYAKYGVVTTDSTNITNRLDPEAAAEWKEKVADPGRLDSMWNPERRAAELD